VASGVTEKAPEPASPSCFAHEADDSYMGFAGPEEIAALLRDVRATAFESAPTRTQLALHLRRMLPKVRDDGLHLRLSALADTLEAGNIPTREALKGLG
jgi:hypothetical protein